MKILCICGARPNFMKIAAVVEAMKDEPELDPRIIHTGQHYDEKLSKVMFDDLRLPRPDINLEVGSASHAVQTSEIMMRFEEVVSSESPDLVMVVGDVNSTTACSLVAAKLGVPVAHVEAGLRSRDRSMPEEINRVVTDSISDLLFASEEDGVENLRREGVPAENIFFVGNVMIDTLLAHRERAAASDVLDRLEIAKDDYAVLTLHRPSNVDEEQTLKRILSAIDIVSRQLPTVFPAHPRTRSRIESFGLAEQVDQLVRKGFLRLTEPLGYLDFLKLTSSARLIMTDSGGIQEEATILGVPCLTLRNNTERPATLDAGWNRLVGSDPEKILAGFTAVMAGEAVGSSIPPRWDGRSGARIARALADLGVDGLHRLRSDRGRASRSSE